MRSGNREGEEQGQGQGDPQASGQQGGGQNGQQGGNAQWQQGGQQGGNAQWQQGGQQGGNQQWQPGGQQGGNQQWPQGDQQGAALQGGGPRGMDPSFYDVRRPLRFLISEFGLDDAQTLVVARVLDQLRCEQAQSAVEEWRCNSALADAFAGDVLDQDRLEEAETTAMRSFERMRKVRLAASQQLFAALDAEQRQKLAYAIRMRLITL